MHPKPSGSELQQRTKALEKYLHESEWKYDLLIKNLPGVIFRGFKDFSVEFVDTKIESLVGYNVEEFNSKKIKMNEIIHEEDLEAVKQCFIQALKTDKSYVREYRVKAKTGHTHWIQERGQILCDAHGEVECVCGVFFDITAQKHAEEQSKLTQFAVDQAQDALYWMNSDARFTYVNDAACRALGYSKEELLTMTVHDIDPEFPKDVWQDHWADLKRRRSFTLQTTHRKKDGKEFPVEVTVNYIKIGSREHNCAFARDLSERKQMQGELLKAQKAEAFGTLTQGIAHDFNNLLSIIMGYIALAEDDIKPDVGYSEHLQEAEKACLRAQELTNQLISFSKGDAPVKNIGSIDNLVKKTAAMFSPSPEVGFEFSISDDLWPVEFDEAQLKHALGNLITNAVESMPDGGKIDIRAENINTRADVNEHKSILPHEKYVKISVRDRGEGISKNNLSKIFDPYFSTKEIGTQKGMGMGLATTYSIMNRHNGHISVESETGIGSTFTVYLPAFEHMVPDLERSQQPAPEKPSSLTGKILVMDDEDSIRTISKQILRRLGYEPEVARDGTEAIELYKNALHAGKPYDAVVLDLTVPKGAGGKETIKTLLEIDPQAKAVVSSGYFSDPVMTDFKKYGFTGALAKPYKTEDLDILLNKVIRS